MTGKLGVYIHIPFCKSKCYYCDFNSSADSFKNEEKYIDYLIEEAEMYSREIEELGIRTIFLGGGTPTAISSKGIKAVLEKLYDINGDREILEVTIEGNPATFTQEKISDYIAAGVNRVSVGVQSLDKDILKAIGRTHSPEDVYDTVNLLKKNGLKNINLDIMFGLPNQTYDDVLDTMKKVISLGVEHISYYGLKLEDGTPLFEQEERGLLELPDEDEERKMYHKVSELLELEGYGQYEISNFSKAGFECLHNLGYWELKPYIGLGLSAASNIDGVRYSNVEGFKEYFECLDLGEKAVNKDSVDNIGCEMEMAEYMMLGLRLNRGVDFGEFKSRFKRDMECVYGEIIKKYIKLGFLDQKGEKLKLTEVGRDLSNQLFAELLP